MCKGPVVVRIKAGARVKEGWCDWGHERDGHNEREKDGMSLDTTAGWVGKWESNRLGFLFQGLWAWAEALSASWTRAFMYPNIIMEHLFCARCLDACNRIMNKKKDYFCSREAYILRGWGGRNAGSKPAIQQVNESFRD